MVVRVAAARIFGAQATQLRAEKQRTGRKEGGVRRTRVVAATEQRRAARWNCELRFRMIDAARGAKPEAERGTHVDLRPPAFRAQRCRDRCKVLSDATASEPSQRLPRKEFTA